MLKENAILRQTIDYLTLLEKQGKLWFSRINNTGVARELNGNRFYTKPNGQKNGIADILVFHKGRTLWLEVKSPTGKQSKEQIHFAESAVVYGGCNYFVVRDVDDARKIFESNRVKGRGC
jgi:hypothetical protein